MSIDNATHDEWNKLKAGEGANLPGTNAMIGGVPQFTNYPGFTQPCPHCGYCPTCGRPKSGYSQYPQWPPYTVICGGTQPLGNQQWQAASPTKDPLQP